MIALLLQGCAVVSGEMAPRMQVGILGMTFLGAGIVLWLSLLR